MDLLRRAFRDIAAGQTRGTILGRAAFIRHLSYADQIEFDQRRDEFYADARDMGIKTDEERLVDLSKDGKWPATKEQELNRARQFLTGLHEGKRKAKMPSMIKDYARKIVEAEKDYEIKLIEKRQLIGLTCETSADQEVNDFYIVSNVFSDAALTTPLFSLDEEFDYFRDDKVADIVRDYNAAIEGCSDQNVKKLAMQPFFQRYFQLAGENLRDFFGKPICALTFYQIDLLRYGAHFRSLYQNHDVTHWKKEVLEDPDLLTDYANTVAKGKQQMQDQGANEAGTIVVGLNKEDSKALNVKTRNPMSEIMKMGGNVTEWAAKQG